MPSTAATEAASDLAAKLMTADDVPDGYQVERLDPKILAITSGIGAIAKGQVEVSSDSPECDAGIAAVQKLGLPDTSQLVGATAGKGPESYTELLAPASVLAADIEGLRTIAASCDGATVRSKVQRIDTRVTFGTFEPGHDLVGVTMAIDTEVAGRSARSYTYVAVGQVDDIGVSLSRDSAREIVEDEYVETLGKVLARLGG